MRRVNKHKKRAQLAFVYSLMAMAVVAGVVILSLILQGYRFNRFDGQIEQGGLVQFDSDPAGATVTLDDIQLANKTASKITATAGTHRITMSRTGYTTWTKTVNVKAGSVLWLNYARLFPLTPSVSTAAHFESYGSSLVSPNRKSVALISTSSQPVIAVVPLDDDTPDVRRVAIDTGAVDIDSNSVLSLVAWDMDNRYLIVKHTKAKTTQYLSVDTRDGTTVNISTLLGVRIGSVEYSLGSSSVVYMLTEDGEVRRGDLGAATISGPLLANIEEFSQADRDTLTYVTKVRDDGTRASGYLTNGTTKPRDVHTVTDNSNLAFRMGTYYGDVYFVTTKGSKTYIETGSRPSSGSSDQLNLKELAVLDTRNVRYLRFSPGIYRFVYVQSVSGAVVYDLELGVVSNATYQAELKRPVDWLDNYHFAAITGGAAYFYDFDGTNGRLISSEVNDAPVVISSNDKYLYFFASSDKGVDLKRILLVNS